MSTIAADVAVQSTSDPNMRIYHSRFEMTESMEEGCRGGDCALGELGKLFLRIRGVVKVSVLPYMAVLTKADLFDWTEIDGYAVQILKDFASSQKQFERWCDDQQKSGDQRKPDKPTRS